jgi:V/A-type H+-transporting ATPase subunit I
MIEPMSHIAILSKTADRASLLAWLCGERCFHPMPLDERHNSWTASFAPLADDTQVLDSKLSRLNAVIAFCQEHSPAKPGFLDSMLPIKVVGSRDEIESATEEVSIDLLYGKMSEMRSGIENVNETITRLQARKNAVERFSFLGDDLSRLSKLKNIVLEMVAVPGQGGKAFLLDARITGGEIAVGELFTDQTHAYFALAAPASAGETLKALIDDHALPAQPVPDIRHGALQELLLLNNDIIEAKAILDKRRAEAANFSAAWLRKVSLAAGHWESEKNLAIARLGMSESSHLFVSRGYIKTEKLNEFRQKLEARLPGAAVVCCDGPEGEEPPISMKWSDWISPASLLVKMYGLPSYSGIDPTPYVATIFFIFVGLCLGDAAYGLALVFIMRWLKRKYAEQAHLQDFFQVFVYCGYVSVVVGILTGSFFGDILGYLPYCGWLKDILDYVTLIDTVRDSQTALYIAVGIGVFTQFYGMALLVRRNWRRGDRMGAFSDGILWMAFLAFILLYAFTGSAFFGYLFLLSAIGLVLTQGRAQKSVFSKFFVGLISLYGVVGGYGISAMLGDLISYARLMALGLTGSVLGSTFNLLASLSKDIPYVGLILAILLVVGGHIMNFSLALLGGFVHSVRLVMLEFFGRFYESGGVAYQPYGFRSSTVDIKKDSVGF